MPRPSSFHSPSRRTFVKALAAGGVLAGFGLWLSLIHI